MSEYIEGEQYTEEVPIEGEEYAIAKDDPMYFFDENGYLYDDRREPKTLEQAQAIVNYIGDNVLVPEQVRHCARLNNILVNIVAAIDPSPMGAGKTRSSLITAYLLGYRKVLVIGTVNGEEAFNRENLNLRLGMNIAYFTFEKFTGRKVDGQHRVDHNFLRSTSEFKTKARGGEDEIVSFWFPLDPNYLDRLDDYEREIVIRDTYDLMSDRFIIIDEIHKAKNESKRSSAIKAFLSGVTSIVDAEGDNPYIDEEGYEYRLNSRILLLSGTPYSKVPSAKKYLSFLNILPDNSAVTEYSNSDTLGLNIDQGTSLSRVAAVAEKGIIVERSVAEGLLDTQIREVLQGTTEQLFKRYISGSGTESLKYALRLQDSKERRAASDEAVNNFYHEIFSMVFLPVVGDSMQLTDLGMVQQNKYNLVIPLVEWNNGEYTYTVDDRIAEMDKLVSQFNTISMNIGTRYSLGDLVDIRIRIHEAMMPDVLTAVYKHLDLYPTSKCIVFLPFTRKTFNIDNEVISFITGNPRPEDVKDPQQRREIIREEERLIGRARQIIRIDGTVKGKDRVKRIDDFNADNNNFRVAIIGLGAGSETISVDDKFGNRPRFSFILLDYNTINIHQAALRTQRLSTKSVGSIYLVHPYVNYDTVSLISIIGASSPVIRFATLSPESETPGDYGIAIGWPPYQNNDAGVSMGVIPESYPNVATAYTDVGFIESMRSGRFAYDKYIERNPLSRMTFKEYQNTFSGLRGGVATAIDSDEDESTMKPSGATIRDNTTRIVSEAPAQRPVTNIVSKPKAAPRKTNIRPMSIPRGTISAAPPKISPAVTNRPTSTAKVAPRLGEGLTTGVSINIPRITPQLPKPKLPTPSLPPVSTNVAPRPSVPESMIKFNPQASILSDESEGEEEQNNSDIEADYYANSDSGSESGDFFDNDDDLD